MNKKIISHFNEHVAVFNTLIPSHNVLEVKPLGDFGEEAEEILQTGGASGRQQAGQQLQG